jgi:hypothetical protein
MLNVLDMPVISNMPIVATSLRGNVIKALLP